jgi:gas vesicle protein GvpL/GvpF
VTALYAYAVVPGALLSAGAPEGIDGAAVLVERAGEVAALVSALDATAYAPETVGEKSQDVEWLAVRASAHDRVVTWASDHGPVIPLPIFSLFTDADSVRRTLRARGAELERVLSELGDGREYTVRVHRVDAELTGTLAALSPEVAHLEARAASATPGQRYLLDRKLEQLRQTEIDRVGRDVAGEVFDSLAARAARAVREPVVAGGGAAGVAVLNASFLVPAAGLRGFRERVTGAIDRFGSRGFRFEFTGPWAPYHFVPRPEGQGELFRASEPRS